MATPEFRESVTADVIIIGAGFSGCYALFEMRRLGFSAKILEADSDFGGVWHFNGYPGARVDTGYPIYQLSLPEAWNGFNFSQRYPGFEELRRYFAHLDKALDLRKDTLFDAKVIEAKYDSKTNMWSFAMQAGLSATSRYAIFAAGTTIKAYIPSFPGLEKYSGRLIHPSAWPKDLDLKGKRIGLFGQGATGVQILQELAKEDCQLTVFIRNPCMAFPMGQRTIPQREAEELKNFYQGLFAHAKYNSVTGSGYNSCPMSFYDASEAARLQHYEQLWPRGGFAFLGSNYADINVDTVANAEVYNFWVKKVRSRITDPIKRDIVAPLKQFQWVGTKRPSLEIDYYEMLDRSNVSLVDLKKTPIEAFTSSGLITRMDTTVETHDLDIVIAATGYDSVTGSLYDMNIRDKHGDLLQEKWKNGISTYLGMVVPGLPNAFFLYGPQAPTSLSSGPPLIELQVEWIEKLLKKAREDGLERVEVSSEAAAGWGRASWQMFGNLLHRETPSWWNGANIPGKPREPLLWFGGNQTWWQECLKSLKDWSKFDVSN